MAPGDRHKIGTYEFTETLFGPMVEHTCVGCGRTGVYAEPGCLDPRCTGCARLHRGVPDAPVRSTKPRYIGIPGPPPPGAHPPTMRPPGRGHGLDGPPCPDRRYMPQTTDTPMTAMCIHCGRLTARRDTDNAAWCGGLLPGETALPYTPCTACHYPLDPVHSGEGYTTHPACDPPPPPEPATPTPPPAPPPRPGPTVSDRLYAMYDRET